ncbi:hypothetical protein ACFOEQ_24490 [Chryseobacterium arachidis]|uniref:hypothetical protein n=1 Tax=Chryseobacterium arachidis TaxID=1416778 RepID=UPI00360992C9
MNEKKLLLSKQSENLEKTLGYENVTSLEIALDILENTSVTELNVFGENIDEIWAEFQKLFRIIEAAGGVVNQPNGDILFIKRLGNGIFRKVKWRKENPVRSLL